MISNSHAALLGWRLTYPKTQPGVKMSGSGFKLSTLDVTVSCARISRSPFLFVWNKMKGRQRDRLAPLSASLFLCPPCLGHGLS